MNKTDIRRIIKEEISRAINENKPKFKPGDHFKYMGTDHEVLDDNGFIVTALTKNGNKVKLNHNQIKNYFAENLEVDRATVIRGIKNVASKTNRDSIINVYLNKHGVESLSDLSIEQLYDLSAKVNNVNKDTKPFTYVDLGKSKGYMGSTYTGD